MVATAWSWSAPLLGVGLAGYLVVRCAAPAAWLLAAVLAVVALRGSLLEYMAALATYGSYDTPPFEGGPGVVALTVLGAALAVTAFRRGRVVGSERRP